MKKIVVVGSANVDYTIKVDRLPSAGETVSDGYFFSSFGGKGANQAVSASKLGAEVTFIGCVGSDEDGRSAVANLKKYGVNVDFVCFSEKSSTGKAFIMVDSNGNNIIAVAPGANRDFTVEMVKKAEKEIKTADVLIAQLEVPAEAVYEAFSIAGKGEVITVLNPAPPREIPPELMDLCDYFTPNSSEAEFYSGFHIVDTNSAARAAMEMAKSGLKNIVITLGERGCYYFTYKGEGLERGYEVKSVDSTGAGDAFNSAFAVMISEGASIEDSLKFANAAGALTTTKEGAINSMPERKEVQKFLDNILEKSKKS